MLYQETVEQATLGLLKKIVSMPECSQFRLVGGTALSLYLGHRKSIDIDLFSDQPFDKEQILEMLEEHFRPFSIINNRGRSILQCIVQDIKVDFVSVKDQFVHPPNIIEGIPFADIKDIAALKLNAIKGRGAKKDFWDIDKLLQIATLNDLLKFYLDRYPYDDTFAVLRSLIYFDDAEGDEDPYMIEKTTWKKVKTNIINAFDNYYKQQRTNK